MPEHANLTDPNLHEPKGVSSANEGSVYVADGAGSGDWGYEEATLSAIITDVSTADTIQVPIPFDCDILKITTSLGGVITSADATITARDSSGSSMGSTTITQSTSAAGDVNTISPVSNNSMSAETSMSISTDGGSSTATALYITITYRRT